MPHLVQRHAGYENADGFSPPRLVRSAQAWWVYPEQARAGDRIRIFGRNLSERWRQALAALVSESGKVLPIEATGKVRHPIYERSFKLPANLLPGRYKVCMSTTRPAAARAGVGH